jgi:CHRD domain
MKLIRLAVLSSLFFAVLFSLGSCEKDAETKKVTQYSKTGIAMTGAKETPANPSTGTGSLDVSYNKASKILTYKVTWQDLSDTITLMHIHGLAPAGYAASPVQNILLQKNEKSFPFRGGSYSGTLLVDGAKIKEDDLLNNLFYMNIHTKTYPAGEIRGQIVFQ